jgi:hypothetical protein
MSRLPPLPGSSYPETLLLLHRACLQLDAKGWDIYLATPEDMAGMHGLISSMPNASEVLEIFLHALGACMATPIEHLVTSIDHCIIAVSSNSAGRQAHCIGFG